MTHLEPVDEFSDRDVRPVAESVVGLEVVVRAVLELDSHEVTVLGRGSAADLKGKGGSKVGCMSTSVFAGLGPYIYMWTYGYQRDQGSA